MPANEFEKKIQQKMDELKLAPSGEVWEQVELRIRKEKKRRRIIFWLPFLFLGLGSGLTTILLMNNSKKNPVVQANELNKTEQAQSVLENKNNKASDTMRLIQNTPQKKQAEKNTFGQTTNPNKDLLKNSHKTQRKISVIKDIKEQEAPSFDLVKPHKKETAKTDLKNNEDDNNKVQLNQPVINKNNESLQQKENSNSDSISVLPIEKQINVQQQDQSKKDSTLQDSVIAAEKKVVKSIKKNKKWQWGIGLEAGSSHISDGIRFSNNYVYADYSAANPSNSTGGSGRIDKASVINAAGSFGVTVFVQRALTQRLNISFDAHYLYLSTNMNVGTHVDSSFIYNNAYSSNLNLNTFYRPSGNSSSYTNKYHFAGLSAELAWQIIKGKKFHIDWSNGISYDHLLSSNALFYDKTLPGYYKNSRLLTHDHLFFSTGLSAPVFKNFFINPFAEYSLTTVQKSAVDPKTHFTNYGLRVKLLFNKK